MKILELLVCSNAHIHFPRIIFTKITVENVVFCLVEGAAKPSNA